MYALTASRRASGAALVFNVEFVAFVAQNEAFVANASLGRVAHARFRYEVNGSIGRGGLKLVSNDAQKGASNSLLHFQVCLHCGSAFRREEIEGRAITSGIFPCTKCGVEGPLNIEIRETDEPVSETQATETT